MSSLDFDLDSQMCHLETEWRQAYETSMVARAELIALSDAPKANSAALAKAHASLDQAESQKSRVMAKIERLESNLLVRGP